MVQKNTIYCENVKIISLFILNYKINLYNVKYKQKTLENSIKNHNNYHNSWDDYDGYNQMNEER